MLPPIRHNLQVSPDSVYQDSRKKLGRQEEVTGFLMSDLQFKLDLIYLKPIVETYCHISKQDFT